MDHADLATNILTRGFEDWDFADAADPVQEDQATNSHGTHVCGTVAAADNATGVIGVAPGCRLMPLRVDLTTGVNQNRADAINYTTAQALANPNRRYVINCSWRMNGDHAGEDFRLVTRTAQGNDTQKWVLMPTPRYISTYTIQQLSNGRYVDAHENVGEDFRVVTRTAQNNDTQRWIFSDIGDCAFTIRQRINGRCR